MSGSPHPSLPSQPSISPSFAERITAALITHRGILALVAVVIALVSVERSRHLQFSRSIDTMFDRSDPALAPYARMTRTFGSNEVVLAAYDDPDLFTADGIARLRGLATDLESLAGVASVTSLASTPLGDRIIDLDGGLTAGWARRLVSLLEGYVVGADHRTACVACVLEPHATSVATPRAQAVSRAGTIDQMRARMDRVPMGTVAGEPAMLRDGFAMLERDGNLLGTGSGLLAGAVLLACFRSLRWLIVPLAVVLLALWSTRGVLAVAGLKLTMVSTMLSAMITVVGIATVTHVIVEFRRQRSLGLDPQAALQGAIAILFWPVLGAIATDVIGFGSLVASNVGPVHDFGIMTSIGAAMVLVAAGLVLPFLALAGRFDADPQMAWGEGTLELGLDRMVKRIVRHPKPILVLSTVLAVIAIAGMRWLTVETDFTRNFRDSSPTVASYEMVESRLGGAGVWDVLVPAREPIDAAQLDALDLLAERLRAEVAVTDANGRETAALTKVMSVADVLSAAPLLPRRLQALTVNTMLRQSGDEQPAFVRALVGRDPQDKDTWFRVMLRARERQPAAAKQSIIGQVRRIVTEEYPAAAGRPGAEVTGFFVLLSQLVDRMLSDQWLTFLLATAGIFVLLAVAFRSPLLAAIALVPNGLPIFVVLGLLGWMGERINMGTAMIAAVSMGLSVDSSIHYITAFRRRLVAGSHVAALEMAHQTAGRAMIFSTLALAIGFLALTTSGFMPTVSFGWLSCLTLLGGLAGNLIVLPVLLVLLAPLIRATSPAA
ncbi:MAG: MMPL family transporter [Planctomycetia bacterium]|nr:MMPL family transporter [Planctomycetia bacterium]